MGACPKCGKQYTKASSLAAHKRNHCGIAPRGSYGPAVCKICAEVFPTSMERGIHYRQKKCILTDKDRVDLKRESGRFQARANPKQAVVRAVAYNKQLRRDFLDAYGGRCACCGESRVEFLTLDHIHGGGKADRDANHGSYPIYARLKREGWPRDRYRILCMNCNHAARLGPCPHETERNSERARNAWAQVA